MPTFNLSNYNCKQIVSSLTKVYAVDLEDITICEPCVYGYSWKVPGSEYIGCVRPDDFLSYLKNFYIDDWHFVKSIDLIDFYYNIYYNVEGTIKYTAVNVTKDEIEVAVSQLSRGSSGWAVLIFYGDELTLIKDKLTKKEAEWQKSLKPEQDEISLLIKDCGYRKYSK
jgi:hypothetical protein